MAILFWGGTVIFFIFYFFNINLFKKHLKIGRGDPRSEHMVCKSKISQLQLGGVRYITCLLL